MSEEFVNIEVNGVPVKARKGEVIIRATDREGVYIPRFCYHDKLPIAANCRMCLVEVEKAPKPLPACATPVAEGMKIFTRSARAIDAQRAVMEFLLINHPLDCPICDQGGECELQDLALGFGSDVSRFVERKRVVKDKNIGPLVSTDMTRCIQCTRCVRFGQNIAGIQELGTLGRSENEEIGTFVERSVDHELSGNIIDLCPVGALNSKPFRYRARGWEMTQYPLVSPHDGVGSQLYGHVLRGRLMRVVPRPCEEINETWIADRDRYSYEGLYTDDRLQQPLVRQPDGQLLPVEWEVALATVAAGLQHAGSDTGLLAHPSSTVEELYLLARLAAGLGSANIDHRLRQRDFGAQAADARQPALGVSIAGIEQLDALLVIGSNLRREAPILAHRVRKAALRGAHVGFINPARFEYLFPVANYLTCEPAQLAATLAAVLAAVLDGKAAPEALAAQVRAAQMDDAHRALAAQLQQGSRRAIWLGALASRSAQYGAVRQLARALAQALGASLGELAEGANAAGAYLAGAVPHRAAAGVVRNRAGLDAVGMLARPLPAYVLLGTEPWADGLPEQALKTLEQAPFVVAVTPYASEAMRRVAHVLLPAAAFAETSGTFVNLEGRWQSFGGAAQAPGQARPAWKILRVLGNLLDLSGFDYQNSEQVRDELRQLACADAPTDAGVPAAWVPEGAGAAPAAAADGPVIDWPMYQTDALVRRAASLARTRDGRQSATVYGAGAGGVDAGAA